MHFLKLDLNLLVALDALLTDPHVTRAAERLRVSQSTLSGSLARLREYFEDELIVQVGRRMELTPLAQELRSPLRELLGSTERLLSTKARFDPASAERCFTITCTDYVWATLLREVVARLATEAPHVRLEYTGSTRDFAERRIELLVVSDRFALDGHPSQALFADPFVCIAWSGNTKIGESLDFEDYFAHRHVVAYSSRPTLVADWIASAHGRHVDVAARAPNFTLVPQSIVGTPYLATVPLRMANHYAKHLPLRILQPPLELPVLADVLQWHGHQDADEGLRWLRQLIVDACRRMDDAPPA
ncbi:LysR family transcriptional regulator [Variovorax sp. PBL-E5]|uniref:LysR family transcriptional regulator n=1 Tax=Variovorax sp. PBL-E5 TaxID=434014 RepID=UPI001317A87B|nr:LysR family transcriptional regulator [Variovorax sp. PBL-E5]VTU36027.1 Nodulation protein D 2 [Variovorax sp. PBL-E5]